MGYIIILPNMCGLNTQHTFLSLEILFFLVTCYYLHSFMTNNAVFLNAIRSYRSFDLLKKKQSVAPSGE